MLHRAQGRGGGVIHKFLEFVHGVFLAMRVYRESFGSFFVVRFFVCESEGCRMKETRRGGGRRKFGFGLIICSVERGKEGCRTGGRDRWGMEREKGKEEEGEKKDEYF